MLQVPSISQESYCPDRWKQSKNIYSNSVMMETKLKGAPSLLTYQWGSVSWYVVVQAPHKPGEAKIRYFTDQVGVDQHVPGRQVSVNKVSLREVTHPCSNSPEHPDKLEDTELTFVLLKKLRDMMEKKSLQCGVTCAGIPDSALFFSPWGRHPGARSPWTQWWSSLEGYEW